MKNIINKKNIESLKNFSLKLEKDSKIYDVNTQLENNYDIKNELFKKVDTLKVCLSKSNKLLNNDNILDYVKKNMSLKGLDTNKYSFNIDEDLGNTLKNTLLFYFNLKEKDNLVIKELSTLLKDNEQINKDLKKVNEKILKLEKMVNNGFINKSIFIFKENPFGSIIELSFDSIFKVGSLVNKIGLNNIGNKNIKFNDNIKPIVNDISNIGYNLIKGSLLTILNPIDYNINKIMTFALNNKKKFLGYTVICGVIGGSMMMYGYSAYKVYERNQNLSINKTSISSIDDNEQNDGVYFSNIDDNKKNGNFNKKEIFAKELNDNKIFYNNSNGINVNKEITLKAINKGSINFNKKAYDIFSPYIKDLNLYNEDLYKNDIKKLIQIKTELNQLKDYLKTRNDFLDENDLNIYLKTLEKSEKDGLFN